MEGPIEYVNVPLDEDRTLRCLESCLLLIQDGERRLAALVERSFEHGPCEPLRVEGETPWRVPPLQPPPDDASPDLQTVLKFPATRGPFRAGCSRRAERAVCLECSGGFRGLQSYPCEPPPPNRGRRAAP